MTTVTSATLIEAFQGYLRRRERTPRTIETYTRTLTVMDQQLPQTLLFANEREISDWIWRDGLKPSTRKGYLAAVREFFRWSVDHAQIHTFNPTTRLHPPKIPRRKPRVATDDQVQLVLTRAIDPFKLWALLAAYAGLRCIEIYRLRREDVTARHITVEQGKGDVPRVLPTHPLIWAEVDPMPQGPLVTGYADERIVSRDFRRFCRVKLDDPTLGLHKLRGWWATNTYRIKKDIRAVQEGMGHVNPGTTAGYIDVADSELQTMVEGLPDLTRKITQRRR